MDIDFLHWLVSQSGLALFAALALHWFFAGVHEHERERRTLMENEMERRAFMERSLESRQRDIENMRASSAAKPKPKGARCRYCGTKASGDTCASCGAPTG